MFAQVSATPDLQTINWIVQGGSFGLVVAIFVWSAYILVPRVLKAFEDRDTKFELMITKIQDRYDKELDRRTAADSSMVVAMSAIVNRLETLELHGCAYRAGLGGIRGSHATRTEVRQPGGTRQLAFGNVRPPAAPQQARLQNAH